VTPSGNLAAVTTGADGAWSLSASANPPANPYRVSITGSDIVSRELWINWQSGTRTGVRLDAIRLRAPFSMEFYRQFVRGTYDAPGAPYAVLRWPEWPRFDVQTVDQNGRTVEPEVLAVIRDAIPRAVSEYSAGKLS